MPPVIQPADCCSQHCVCWDKPSAQGSLHFCSVIWPLAQPAASAPAGVWEKLARASAVPPCGVGRAAGWSALGGAAGRYGTAGPLSAQTGAACCRKHPGGRAELERCGRDRSVRAEDAEKRSGVGSTGGIGSGVYTIVSSAFVAHRPAFRLPSALYHSTDLPLCGSVCLSGPRGPLHGRCDSAVFWNCCFWHSADVCSRRWMRCRD